MLKPTTRHDDATQNLTKQKTNKNNAMAQIWLDKG